MAGRKGEKHWRDALMVAINRTRDGDPEGRKYLAVIAQKTVDLAADGDMAAIREIGDRLDGKAPVSVDVGSDPDRPIKSIIEVAFVSAAPKAIDA